MIRTILCTVILCGLASSAFARGGAGGGAKPLKGKPVEDKPVEAKAVEVKKLETRTVAAGHTFVGTVQPSRRSRVSVETSGFVLSRPVRLGQRVEKDAIVATIKADLIDKQLAISNARVVQEQKALDILRNGFRDEEKREAASALARANATLALRIWKSESAQRLFDDGRKVTEDTLRDAKLAVVIAERLVDAATARNEMMQNGARADEIARAESRVLVEQADVARLTYLKTLYEARAPFAGYVVSEGTEEGEWIQTGSPIVELIDLDHVDVVVPVLEDYIAGIQVGQTHTVVVPSLGERPFEGTVVGIVPEAAVRSRALPVRIRVKNVITNGVPMLKAGMYVRATLPVGEPHEALMAPKDALKLGGPRPEIFVVDPESKKALPIPVALGVADGEWIEVRGDLRAGQHVVTKGNERLRPGAVVKFEDD